MPGRRFSAGTGYRYGFNGKEQDKDISSLATYDYGFRIYDPALGRFLSVDPLIHKYVMLTSYQFACNRPVDGIDLDGLEYLKGNISKINVYISFLEFDGKIVISGSVGLKPSNIDGATKFYLEQNPDPGGGIGSPKATIATFESKDYADVSAKIVASFSPPAPKASEAKDAADDVKSLKQPELEIEKKSTKKLLLPGNNDRGRKNRISKTTGVSPTSPSPIISGGGSSPTGDLLVNLAEWAGDAGLAIMENRVKNDYKTAVSQLTSANSVVNDIQFAINNKIIESKDLSDLTGLANYLLDGTVPIFFGSYQKGNETVHYSSTDYLKLKRFEEIKSAINRKKYEIKVKSNPIFSLKPY